MAVLLSCEGGSILDHNIGLAHSYQYRDRDDGRVSDDTLKKTYQDKDVQWGEGNDWHTTGKASEDEAVCRSSSFQLKRGFFAVHVPFMMDSQFETVCKCLSERAKTCDGESPTMTSVSDLQQILADRKRRRKRKLADCETAEENEVNERLSKVHASLMTLARERGIFQKYLPTQLDNNKLSRQCAQLDQDSICFSSVVTAEDTFSSSEGDCSSEEVQKRPLIISASGQRTFTAEEVIHRRVEHPSDKASVVNIDGQEYILPPSSVFLLSDLHNFCSNLHKEIKDDRFDLIVVDPPWENKSVKRKKSYEMVGESSLKSIPISHLARHGCLVALWVTNNDRLEEFATGELFPAWGLRLVGKWHWLKVTQTGDMVTSLSEGHKKPYEVLLLGRTMDSASPSSESSNGDDSNQTVPQDPPDSHVMMSVPCSLHSKKVPLADILSPYLPERPRCLELFARNLWPGWTSWGQEALRHQNRIFYEEVL